MAGTVLTASIQWAGTVPSLAFRRLIWLTGTVVITAGCLTPVDLLPIPSYLAAYGDACIHFAMYLVYALICQLAFPPRRWSLPKLVGSAAMITAFSLFLETLQGALPALGRHFSIEDVLANALGAGTGAWFWARAQPGR